MPTFYASFQIKNTTDVPMVISVNDPDGNVHKVGTLEPGKESIQHAPMGATWSLDLATPATQEYIQSPEDVKQPSSSDPGTSDKGGSNVTPSTLIVGTDNVTSPADNPQALPSGAGAVVKVSEPIEYEAFLKLETGTHSVRINQLLVTPDSKTLITSGSDKTIRVWDIENKEQVRLLLGQIGPGPRGSIQRIALSPDGKYLAALAWMYPDNTENPLDRETDLRVYDLTTGNLQAGYLFRGTLQDLDFSPNGNYIVFAGNKKDPHRSGRVYVYSAKSLIQGFGDMPPALATGILHDTNQLIPSLVRFIPDGKGESTEVRIVAATWIDVARAGRLKWFSFSPAGGLTMTREQDTEQLAPESLTVSREYVILTAHHEDKNKFYCHDHTGNLLGITSSETAVAQPTFSKDEKHLIVGQRGDSALVQIKVYAVTHGQFHLKSTYYGHDSEAIAVALLEDGIAVSAGGDQNAIHFWSTEHLEGEKISEISGVGRTIHALGINTSEQIGVGSYDGLRHEDGRIVLQRLFDLRSMTLRSSYIDDEATYQRSQTRFEDWELIWLEDNVNLWLFKSGSQSMAITGTPHPTKNRTWIWYHPTTFGFTENGTIITGAGDGKIRVAPRHPDWGYQTPLRLLGGGYSAPVKDHVASGKWLVTAGADQIIRLWFLEDVESPSTTRVDPDKDTLTPALNLFIGSDDEWVIWSKSGYYNASQRGDRRFGYHVNRGAEREALFFSSDRFKAFFRPDIIQAIVEHGSEERAIAKLGEQGLTTAKIDVSQILPPIVELTENGVHISDDGKEVIFTFSVDTHGQLLTRVWALRNGRLVHAQKAVPPNVMTLPLLPGENRFKIFAETQFAKSIPIEQTVIGKGRLDQFVGSNGTLYVLAIGVSKLENEAPESNFRNLNYAHSDATEIYNAFAKEIASNKLEVPFQPFSNEAFEAVDRTLLVNEEATLIRIQEELDKICARITDTFNQRVENREAAKRDVLLVFLSGHGVFRARNQQLYFWNYDFDLENIDKTGLSFMELGEKITSLPAEVILMTDACHAGMAGGDVVKGIDPNELAKRIYGINESEMYIFNAARRSEKAREDPSIDQPSIYHGYFTKTVLDILFDEKNPKVSMLELIDQVQWGVQRYTTLQTPVCRMYGDLLPLVIYEKKYLLSNK